MTEPLTDQDDLGLPESGEGPGEEAGSNGSAEVPEARTPDGDAGDAGTHHELEPVETGEEETEDVDADLRVIELEAELQSLNDRHLRLAAEFNNFRRRTEHERLSAWDRAQAELIGRFLDVLDDLQRVSELDADQTTLEGLMEGIDLVERKFVRTLEDVGIEVIDPVGEPFDPERMEAMMRVPAEGDEDDDRVAQVFQKGYTFRGHLVRPARVSVHKHG